MAKRVVLADCFRTSKDMDTDMAASDSERALEKVEKCLLIRSLLQPIAYWASQGTIGSRVTNWALSPSRQRLGDHIHVHNLCSPFGTPTLCAFAQNIRVACHS